MWDARFATTPAEAGAQLGTVALVGAALRYLDLSNWAPAFAGVVASVLEYKSGQDL